MIGDQEDGPGCWHVVPARGTPAPQRREQGCKHVLHEPVPEQFAPPAIGAGAGAVTSRPTGRMFALAGTCRRGLGSHRFAHGKSGSGKCVRKARDAPRLEAQVVTRHPAFVIRHPSFPIPRSEFRIPHSLVRRGDASDKLLDHLVDGHAAGVDQHGVFGRFHGGDGAGDVAGVTNTQLLKHRLEAERPAGCL